VPIAEKLPSTHSHTAEALSTRQAGWTGFSVSASLLTRCAQSSFLSENPSLTIADSLSPQKGKEIRIPNKTVTPEDTLCTSRLAPSLRRRLVEGMVRATRIGCCCCSCGRQEEQVPRMNDCQALTECSFVATSSLRWIATTGYSVRAHLLCPTPQ
jgi:hypothetical protein